MHNLGPLIGDGVRQADNTSGLPDLSKTRILNSTPLRPACQVVVEKLLLFYEREICRHLGRTGHHVLADTGEHIDLPIGREYVGKKQHATRINKRIHPVFGAYISSGRFKPHLAVQITEHAITKCTHNLLYLTCCQFVFLRNLKRSV